MEESEMRATPATGRVCPTLADDLLDGADKISVFLFGDEKKRRRVYHLVETARLPHFRLGGIVCARKSRLIQWIEEQEARSTEGAGK